jgi:uncharacterized protein (TIRG00374 family)
LTCLISNPLWKGSIIAGWIGIILYILLPVAFNFYQTKLSVSILSVLQNSRSSFFRRSSRILENVFLGLQQITNKKILLPVFLTILGYLIVFLQCYLVAQAFSMNISIVLLAQFMAIANLIVLLPISIAGLGTREVALLTLFLPLGFGQAQILAYSMGVFVVFYLSGGLIGSVAWFFRPISFSALNQFKKKETIR